MKVTVFSTKPYDREFLTNANSNGEHDIVFLEPRLTVETASLASGREAICAFVNDVLNSDVLAELATGGTRWIALRCAGFNNVDLEAAKRLEIGVVRVPAYSPHAVAEYAVSLLMTLNRKIHRAFNRVREGDFSLNGLMGSDLHGKTVGVIGTGKIGMLASRIFHGLGCELVGFDVRPNPECLELGMSYHPLETIWSLADVISLHCPLTPDTFHLVDDKAIAQMKPGVVIINTSRGAVIDTKAAIVGLKSGTIGGLAIDVYEEEADYFFEDFSHSVITDDTLARLLTFPNVIVTSHQGFFTREALDTIARTTMANLTQLEKTGCCDNAIEIIK